MKLSISVGDDDLAVLDAFVAQAGLGSRSAGIQHAIGLLRERDLEQQYATAFEEWQSSGDAELWESTAADGLAHEAW